MADNNSSFIQRLFRNKKVRIGAVMFFIGYGLLVMSVYFRKYISLGAINPQVILDFSLRAIPIVVTLIGMGYFLYGYLEGKNQQINPNRNYENTNHYDIEVIKMEFRRYVEELRYNHEKNTSGVKEIVEQLKYQLDKQKEIHINENQTEQLFTNLRHSFSENINDNFFKQLNENISNELTKEKRNRLEFLLKDFNSIKSRLNSEIDKLNRKANLNLVIGSLTTFIALIALSFVVFQNNKPFTNYIDILYHYLPRLSLIIFIEVFAYFFLRLYKLNLDDMKYFQNELTTVELKLASIITAINFGKDIDITAITNELSKTERNFILKKGETTVELEKLRTDKNNVSRIFKSLTDIANREK